MTQFHNSTLNSTGEKSMKDPIKILYVYENGEDIISIDKSLKKASFNVEEQLVNSQKTFLKALKEFPANIIVADITTSSFSASQALKILNKKGIKIPLILVSDHAGIDEIVENIKSGASDYIHKDQLHKLPGAINSALEKFRLDISERVKAEHDLTISEERYRFLFEYSATPKWIFDLENGQILDVNETAVKHYGYSREEFLNMITNDLKAPEELPRMAEIHKRLKDMEGLIHFGIFTQVKKDGTKIKAEVSGHKCSLKNRQCMVIDSFDVTE